MATTEPPPVSEGFFRLSVAQFLIALVGMLITLPFLEEIEYGPLIEAILLTVVLLSAVVAVGGRRRTLVAATILVTPAVASKWIAHFCPAVVPREFTQAASILFVGFVVVRLLHFILTAPQVNTEVLCAAIAVYLLLGLLWSFAYGLIARQVPNAFAYSVETDRHQSMMGFQALYFSFCTLTTVGYGDIVPVANAARMLAMAESTVGVFFATILIARLVALYSAGEPIRRRRDSNS